MRFFDRDAVSAVPRWPPHIPNENTMVTPERLREYRWQPGWFVAAGTLALLLAVQPASAVNGQVVNQVPDFVEDEVRRQTALDLGEVR